MKDPNNKTLKEATLEIVENIDRFDSTSVYGAIIIGVHIRSDKKDFYANATVISQLPSDILIPALKDALDQVEHNEPELAGSPN